MRELMIDVDKTNMILQDNVTVMVDGIAFITVLDSYKVV